MSARRVSGWMVAGLLVATALLVPAGVAAQRGGRGGGGGGGGGVSAAAPSRMAILTAAFTLEDAQKKQVKTIFDAGFKDAAPIRTELGRARVALALAIQAGKSEADIDAAAKAYATQATAMMEAESRALAQFMKALTEEQRANKTASQSAVYMMRGIFAGKKWDTAPDVRFY